MWHLSKKKKKEKQNIQYITTFTVKFQTFKSIYQNGGIRKLIIISTLYTSRVKSWSEQSIWSFQLCTVLCFYTTWRHYKHKVHFLWLNFNKIHDYTREILVGKAEQGGKRSILSQIYMHVIHAVGHSCFHHFPCQDSLIVGLLCSVFMFYKRQCDKEVQEWPLHVHCHH